MKLFTIPNIITLGNLLCGCIAIVFLFNHDFQTASLLIFVALILDFFDGFVARLLKMHSEIGKQLDSLADMVTFGILPSLMIFKYIEIYGNENYKYIALLLALFSALRLAKFNIDTRQSDGFIGLPTPANAIVVATFPLLESQNNTISNIIHNQNFLIAYVLIFSYLLIMELPLLAFKFKTFSWNENKIKYCFMILSVILFLALQIVAIPIIVILYILLSIIVHFKWI